MIATDTTTIPTKDPLRKEWVKFQLRARGDSLSQIARDEGLARNTVAMAFLKPYPRMERIIASRLGLRPEKIWPERYDAHGRPNRPKTGRPPKSSATKVTTRHGGRNVHARKAA